MNRQKAEEMAFVLLRVVTAVLFIQAGGMKLFGWFGGMPGGATAPVMSQIWIGAVLEVVGGLAIMLGLFTRPIAFILSGEMAVAYWQFHAPNGRWPIQNHGELSALMCFLFLYMSARGAGTWSLDAMMQRRAGPRP